MKPRFTEVFKFICLSGLVLISGLAGCIRKKEMKGTQAQKKVPLVAVQEVKKGSISHSLNLTGEVVPVDTVQITSTVEGPINFCPWREGDHVSAGQRLIEIDRELIRAEVKAAEAAVSLAKAKLADMQAGTRPEEIEKARQNVREAEETVAFEKLDYERISQLVKTGALAGEQAEKARVRYVAAEARLQSARKHLEMLESGFTATALAVQEAAVKEAEARLKLAQARLNECIIKAPFSGVITKVFVRPGDLSALRMPLVELANLSSQVIRCAVPESVAGRVHPGMLAEVRLDAFPEKLLRGTVSRVFPALDAQLKTRTIEIAVGGKIPLSPNMFARVRLLLETAENVVVIPGQAVVVSPTGATLVFVVKEGKAVRRPVKTGIEEEGRIQILSGLSEGEQLVISGQEKLKDGVEVRVAGKEKLSVSPSQPPGKNKETKAP